MPDERGALAKRASSGGPGDEVRRERDRARLGDRHPPAVARCEELVGLAPRTRRSRRRTAAELVGIEHVGHDDVAVAVELRDLLGVEHRGTARRGPPTRTRVFHGCSATVLTVSGMTAPSDVCQSSALEAGEITVE